jgi:hypothetical protein
MWCVCLFNEAGYIYEREIPRARPIIEAIVDEIRKDFILS